MDRLSSLAQHPVLDKLGGTEADIKGRLALARIAFTRLQNIWRSGRFSQTTRLRILNSNVLSVLLYGAEMWRVTTTDFNKLVVFHRTCLRRVLRRFWPNHLSNERRALRSNREYAGISPYTSEKMAMDRTHIED